MQSEDIIGAIDGCTMKTYRRLPAALVKGDGMRVWDAEGVEYRDFVGGVAVNILGHSHPALVEAICRQAGTLMHVSNLYYTDRQAELSELLVNNSFADRVFFCNSGTEAVEGAIKLIRKYAHDHGKGAAPEIIAAHNSFHGRSYGALSATGQEKLKAGFGPMLEGFHFVPYGNIRELGIAIKEETCAVILEPILGESGVKVPEPGYLKRVRDLCSERGVLMVLDEIQTGIGRTGKLFAYEHEGIEPDVVTLAKGLGAGFPIGAILAREEVAESFSAGTHGSTFGGNALASAAAATTLAALLADNGAMLLRIEEMGQYLYERLLKLKGDFPAMVLDVRGRGLLVGMEVTVEASQIVQACLGKGFLINATAGNVLRFMPAAVVEKEDIDDLAEALAGILGSYGR